ncbi:unnamed protein product [Nesidiocoris tenuis]|uniref:Uncharacterized protein n=1 Tax=Nesidiocoris tenuis TaxID=355587 RepID=A0A6H5G2D9_9HEMI|nr:unnamed protein product [Nesidiocoris tenuis]
MDFNASGKSSSAIRHWPGRRHPLRKTTNRLQHNLQRKWIEERLKGQEQKDECQPAPSFTSSTAHMEEATTAKSGKTRPRIGRARARANMGEMADYFDPRVKGWNLPSEETPLIQNREHLPLETGGPRPDRRPICLPHEQSHRRSGRHRWWNGGASASLRSEANVELVLRWDQEAGTPQTAHDFGSVPWAGSIRECASCLYRKHGFLAPPPFWHHFGLTSQK